MDKVFGKDYFSFVDSESDVLVVAFSHVGYPAGKFAFTNAISSLNCKKIYFNCMDNSWYQQGVPGGDSIEGTAKKLKEIIDRINPCRVIFLGMSMGGYAALTFGILCGASHILAFTAELSLGAEHLRSYKENNLKKYDPVFKDISNLINSNVRSLVFLIYGELDLVDLSGLFGICQKILVRDRLHFFLCKGGHQCTLQLNVPLILNQLINNGWLSSGLIDPDLILDYEFEEREFMLYKLLQELLNSGRIQDIDTMLAAEPLLEKRPLLRELARLG